MSQSPDDEIDLDEMLGPEPVADNVVRLRPKRRPFQPWTIADIESAPDLGFLIGDEDRPILLEGSLWQVFGKKKSAKTFYCLELAFCIAFGIPFHGMPAKQGQVIYILAEGGMKRNFKRIRALFDKHKDVMAERGYATLAAAMNANQLLLLDQTIKLADSEATDPTSPESFIKEMRMAGVTAPALIVLDTWARALMESGGNVNSQEHVGPSVQSCEMIRRTFGGCSLIMVAHVGVANNDRAKGLTDPIDAVDGATRCRETTPYSGIFEFKMTEQRHAESGFTITAELRKPSDNSLSVALYSSGAMSAAARIAKLPKSARDWYDVLVALEQDQVTVAEWIAAGVARGLGKGDAARRAMQRAREKLVEAGVISVDSDSSVTLTPDKMLEADAGDDFEPGDDDDT